jgi:phage-related protein
VSLADPELDVAESTRQLMESVGDAAGLIIPRVATILETLFTYVSEHGPEIWEQFKQSMMDSLPEEWQTKVGDARKAIEDFFGAVETAGKALQPFVNVIIWAGNEIKGVADIIDGAIRFITGAPKKVDDSMNNTDYVLEKHGEAVMDGFARGAEWSWDENKGFFSNIGSWIQEHKGPLGADAVLLEPAGRAIIDGFMGGASSSWNSQNHMFGEMASSIGMMFNGSENLLWTAGHNIIVGLWNGMIEAWNRAASWVQGIGSWIQQHKGPESYDKKLLVNNGKWIMGGFQSGLESGFEGGVIPYVSGMGRDIQDALGASVSSPFATTVGRAVATPQQRQQPTMITAILELDRVQFGRLVYQLNGEETQRMGVNLAGGMA